MFHSLLTSHSMSYFLRLIYSFSLTFFHFQLSHSISANHFIYVFHYQFFFQYLLLLIIWFSIPHILLQIPLISLSSFEFIVNNFSAINYTYLSIILVLNLIIISHFTLIQMLIAHHQDLS